MIRAGCEQNTEIFWFAELKTPNPTKDRLLRCVLSKETVQIFLIFL